ncbi:MAG: Rrf2 family transcriptional regulator [Elusimicrobia bacterium]|nr:Rrf2 family transcriptional regulator [Elusimicrobiota bacterium]
MIFPRAVDHGLYAMLYLAAQPLGESFPAARIAKAVKVPPKVMSPLLKRLVRAGLLGHRRGLRGGYVLHRLPQDISMQDVVIALHGQVCLQMCQETAHKCRRSDACPFRPFWLEVQRDLAHRLSTQNLKDMAKTFFLKKSFARKR